jgi:putative glutathione S-transferase
LAREAVCRPQVSVRRSLTEADIRLFTTLIRFDAVYAGHFKCNIRRIADYPNLSAYTRDIYQWPGIAATVNFEHIRRHYYESHRSINPTGIVPAGPPLDFTAPHGREHLVAASTPSRNVAIDRDCASTGSAVMGIANGNPSI